MNAEIVKELFQGLEVRAIQRDGEFWFVASDVAKALDIGNPTQALKRLDEDEVTLISNEGQSGVGTNYISESGLYALILGSRKPQAKPFKRWVTHDLLPTLRRTGFYSLREPVVTVAAIARAYGYGARFIPDYLLHHGISSVGWWEHPDTGKPGLLFDRVQILEKFAAGFGPQAGDLRNYSGPWTRGPVGRVL
jgi:hypothetical protein